MLCPNGQLLEVSHYPLVRALGLALGKWRAVVELCDGLEGTRALIAKR
jgi:hypothetical protein